ncbi:MAG: MarR family transcriptional regulator [Actinomycetota bacterium]|nr:MarR family transcriptional regulator [Actinomycetota bacterium]
MWFQWKRTHEMLRLAVVSEVTAATGVSEPDLTVLIQLHGGSGVLRQNALAASIGWDRTRLSHLLTRMEARGYLTRRKAGPGVEVVISAAGRAAVEAAQGPLHNAVQNHLLGRLRTVDKTALRMIFDRLADVE